MVVRVHRFPTSSSLFDNLLDLDSFFESPAELYSERLPSLDIAEYDKESVVVAELPGVPKEDVKISVHDGVLTISGERKSRDLPAGSKWVRNEIAAGRFSRSVTLPHEVNPDRITAELTNGILRVVLPKAEKALPREIMVR